MLVLTRTEVEELLDVDALFDALARAHVELSAGAVSMPPRVAAWAGDAGLLGFQSIGSFVYAPGPVGAGNPIDAGVTFPFTDGETSTFGMVVTGADPNNIVDVYSVDNPDFDGVPAVVANKFVISGGHPGVPDAASTGLLCLFSLVGLAAARRWVRR